jgi:hypothetical protein
MRNMMNNLLVVVWKREGCWKQLYADDTHTCVDLNRGWIGLQSSTAPQARGHNPHQGGRNWGAA